MQKNLHFVMRSNANGASFRPMDSTSGKLLQMENNRCGFVMKHEGIFSMAGLFDTWTAPDGSELHSCTIITTRPNELMADIHNRMPVILRREDENRWLNRERFDTELLQSLLVPYPADQMLAYSVSQIVGNVRNDSPDCIETI